MIRLTNAQGLSVVAMLETLKEQGDLGPVSQQLLDQLNEQLTKESHDIDIVDTVAKLISDKGRARQIITDEKLELLRRAIFSPRELMRLQDNADSRICDGCSREIVNEQLCMFIGANVFCSACSIASIAPCGNCLEPLDIYDDIQKTLRKCTKNCKACARNREKVAAAVIRKPVAPPEQAVQGGQALGGQFMQFDMPAAAVRYNWVPIPQARMEELRRAELDNILNNANRVPFVPQGDGLEDPLYGGPRVQGDGNEDR